MTAMSADDNAPGQPKDGMAVQFANPAAIFCIKNVGTHVIRKAPDGSENGVCILSGGTEIDAWTFFQEHAPKG